MTSTEVGTMRVSFTFTDEGELSFVWRNVPFADVTQAMRRVQALGVTTPLNAFRENPRECTIHITTRAIVRGGATLKEVVDMISGEIERYIPAGSAAADIAMTASSTTVAWH